jgi:hypothetical protein
VLVALFLAMWLPATNHCLLETFSDETTDQCCSAETSAPVSNSHCESCDAVEKIGFKFKQENSFSFAHASALSPLLALERFSDQQSFVPIEISTQPQLPAAWQFVFRAALPIRAPSFVS